MDVGLQYVGKKLPFTFKNPILGEGEKIKFVDHETVVFVNSEIASWIFKHNPYGFVKKVEKHSSRALAKKEAPVEEIEEVVEEVVEELICPHCFRKYSDKMWFDKHVAKCVDSHVSKFEIADDAA